ncbi:LacI family DNA-binding transcriptional regulator [Demequina maris]|uniref:LacI family DNA-binding transcriptional regulator n=1 Tax=Demequina maris TaxID=1638982 RepID=UPI0007827DC3|nr:LacI family DNA-binding transcriptional regulator [Demequina maris]
MTEPGQRRSGRAGAATIYDIAERAGVNPSTVSRALNHPGRVSAATEARIRQAADELDFHANPMARALPTGRTRTLALVLADVTNPVVFGLIRGAERAAAAAGYTLVIAESQESGAVEAATVERVAPAVDGIVLATSRLADDEIGAIAARKPVVTVNRGGSASANVSPDVEPGIAALVAHLESLGHRTLAFLAGPANSWTSTRRWDALFAAARRAGLHIVEIGPNAPTVEGGGDAYERCEASGATAVVAYNDLMAMGLIQAARAAGRRVPEDLSIVGFDDIFGAALITPALTTVRADLELAGEHAVTHLLALMGEGAAPADCDELATELVVRDSTGPAPTR